MLISTPPNEPTPPAYPYPPTVVYVQPAPKAPYNGFAVASLATGITSIPTFFCCYLGLAVSVVAVGLGIAGYIQSNKMNGLGRMYSIVGMSLAGVPWVLGTILLVITLAV